jgi:hypothetical protein
LAAAVLGVLVLVLLVQVVQHQYFPSYPLRVVAGAIIHQMLV